MQMTLDVSFHPDRVSPNHGLLQLTTFALYGCFYKKLALQYVKLLATVKYSKLMRTVFCVHFTLITLTNDRKILFFLASISNQQVKTLRFV